MADVADYIILKDTTITLVPSQSPGPQSESTLSFTPPANIKKDSLSQSPLISFMVKAPTGNIGIEIDLNGQRLLNATAFNDPNARSFHEVINRQLIRPGVVNDLVFRVVSGEAPAEVRISDIIVWFQREGFGPNN